MRSTICHLIDPASPGGGECTLRLLAGVQEQLSTFRHEVIVLGAKRHVVLAQRCGVKSVHHIPLPRFHPAIARRSLRRWIDCHEAVCGPLSLLHAWTPRAARLAVLSAPQRKRLASFTLGPTCVNVAQRLAQLVRLYPMPILACSEAVAEEFRTIGLNVPGLTAVPLAVEPNRSTPATRKALRERWRVNDDVFVVALLSEPAEWADAEIGMEMISRPTMTGRCMCMVIHPGAHRRLHAEKRSRALFNDGLLVTDAALAEPWRILPGVDTVLAIGSRLNTTDVRRMSPAYPGPVLPGLAAALTGGGRRLRPMPGVGAVLHAMAAGVPVVAEGGGAVAEILEHGETGLLIKPGHVNKASEHLMHLHDDAAFARRIGTAGRDIVQRSFHLRAFCDRLATLYDEVMLTH